MMTRAGGARTRTTKITRTHAGRDSIFCTLAFGPLSSGNNNQIHDDAKCILRARLGGTYGLSTAGHLVVALWRPSLARTVGRGGGDGRISPVLSLARYLFLSLSRMVAARNLLSLSLSRCSRGGASHFRHSQYAHKSERSTGS